MKKLLILLSLFCLFGLAGTPDKHWRCATAWAAVENFTTGWTETDPNSHLSQTTTRSTWTSMNYNEVCKLQRNSAISFTGDFDVAFDFRIDSASVDGGSWPGIIGFTDGGNNIQAIGFNETGAVGKVAATLAAYNDNTWVYEDASDLVTLVVDTVYYGRFRRDDDAGTYGTLYLDIYPTNADRIAGTSVLVALSRTITVMGKVDLVQARCPYTHDMDDTTSIFTGYLENLDLAYVIPPTTDQKSFQFFNANGALPQKGAVASSSTVTVMNSGSDTAATKWTTDVPAQSTGDMIIVNLVSDANVTHGVLPGGPLGETAWTINTASLGDTETANQRISCWYWTASNNNAAWSIIITPSATEQRTATVMKVPAGQYSTTTPIGETANAVNSSAAAALPSPSWTVTSAGARVVVWIGDDQDPLVTAPTGWSVIASVDRGNVNGMLSLRNAVTTANEVVASATWTIASDSYCSIGYAINPPADTGRTALAVAGTDPTLSVDTSYGVDLRLENTGATSSDHYKLQYKLNAGSWTDITDASSVIIATLTGDFANGDDVPEYITGSGTYDTDNNAALESAGDFTLGAALAASHSTECHLNFQIPNADVVNGDKVYIRAIYNAGGVLEAYTDTPEITVSEGGAYTGWITITNQ